MGIRQKVYRQLGGRISFACDGLKEKQKKEKKQKKKKKKKKRKKRKKEKEKKERKKKEEKKKKKKKKERKKKNKTKKTVGREEGSSRHRKGLRRGRLGGDPPREEGRPG